MSRKAITCCNNAIVSRPDLQLLRIHIAHIAIEFRRLDKALVNVRTIGFDVVIFARLKNDIRRSQRPASAKFWCFGNLLGISEGGTATDPFRESPDFRIAQAAVVQELRCRAPEARGHCAIGSEGLDVHCAGRAPSPRIALVDPSTVDPPARGIHDHGLRRMCRPDGAGEPCPTVFQDVVLDLIPLTMGRDLAETLPIIRVDGHQRDVAIRMLACDPVEIGT